MVLLKIILINGVPTYEGKEVILNTIQTSILKGREVGGYVLIHIENLVYKENK